MASDRLRIHARPAMKDARMVLGFSGWMNGGEVSTGTVEYLVHKLNASALADIDAEDLYLFNFPGSMEVASLFRPYTKIEEGMIVAYQVPMNRFFYNELHNLILFVGKEPNFKWAEYCDCIFSLASQFGVSMIYFIGSVAGLVPHTREPRLSGSVSDEGLKSMLQRLGVRLSDYEGPAGISTHLTHQSGERSLAMVTLVAEIPAYVQGKNHRCIESVARRLSGLLNLQVNLDELRVLADGLEERLNEIVEERPELAERVQQLEADYDNEVFDTQMGDLKDWLQRQGIRLD